MYMSLDYIDIILIVAKIIIAAILLILAAAYMTFIERKVVAWIQVRVGPTRCGPAGILQPIADAVKLMLKEDIIPSNVDRFIWGIAPIITVVIAITAFSIIPLGDPFTVAGRSISLGLSNVNVGVLVFLALSSIGVYGVFLAGWGSNSRYSLFGGMRAGAQMISYELVMALSVVTVCLWADSMNLSDIVKSQMNTDPADPVKYIMIIPHVIALGLFTIALFAETNRAPFDLPECENELVAGFHTEYSGLRFAMFYLGEYVNIIVGSALLVTLFLGGWMFPFGLSETLQSDTPAWGSILSILWFILIFGILFLVVLWIRAELPVPDDTCKSPFACRFGLPFALGLVFMIVLSFTRNFPAWIPLVGLLWFVFKLALVLFVFMWVRATLPRFRYDQLMSFGWKFLFPVALGNLVLMVIVKLLVNG